ncbi:anthranilate synthase component II [Staphylococcus massiliensis]|uniref:Para-aminobenzoate synthase, glutamine amidotransferase, component II n=1 Tax=Staphylococcus massiliensis S46 TaxID=1229783 RepID=K9B442_9STAP|nr:aminodeoxychorismate/anthranilate synthase component II [Staphylococcus massiliensis]EKU48555.1 para-aminobenzoate synthase, glutamine amidotransferase, component II [Staphylococcus massiliensis S46]MCG3400108.1 aminodeoxychorismate/anthranilate synthase component II [Staphylococcus massiliensis]MCG3401830.1 aminodeoxychorismate/anthranilate synthase component II [Staphylococcus massiliensis]MCG3413162.1 aminodeoxychorismate/anthranilate synthase component II [Staphylococcus massiliensis]PO
MIVIINNKDSFTYNLVDYVSTETTRPLKVIDVDAIDLNTLKTWDISALIISPGPKTPKDYPILFDLLSHYETRVPILGVCLGFQLIVSYYGGDIVHNEKPVHGHTTSLTHSGKVLFQGLPQGFEVMRYHSLMAKRDSVREPLQICASNEKDVPMAVSHQSLPIYGLQYHPESYLSAYGHEQIRLFLAKVGASHVSQH